MSQVFAADSVNNTAAVTVTTTSETPAVTGNFVNPPFQNAKAIITGIANLTAGTAANGAYLRIRRNPNAENAVVGVSAAVTVTAGNVVLLYFQAADAPIGPGPVQYQVTVQQNAATGNGTVNYANVTTFLISG